MIFAKPKPCIYVIGKKRTMTHNAIVWFRNDLRIHDNEALTEALNRAETVIPVYVFDERIFFAENSIGLRKTEKFRANFIIESVADLRKNIMSRGGRLIVRIGKPEDILYDLARKYQSSWVYCNRERTHEEVLVQDKLEKKLWTIGRELRYARGKMLLHTADLPFPVSQIPDTFTAFRKEIEGSVSIRQPLEPPQNIPCPSMDENDGEIPTLADFNYENIEDKYEENEKFKGGETLALNQVHYYMHESRLISTYKEQRNNMLGWDYSSKFSPWLSSGSLSPKWVYYEIKKYESSNGSNDSTYWLYFELLWRDYFRFIGKKYGNKLFRNAGIRDIDFDSKNDAIVFDQWKNGQTGMPIIDACMRQLNATGFMSNRGRQLVASFLVKDLKIPWLMGAEYFESLLIDYDPCSNYGNWQYIAGVGNDPREDRYFNILSQAKRYDPQGHFVKFWIPELAQLPDSCIHSPYMLDLDDQARYDVFIGQTYPDLIVSPKTWTH